MIQAHVRQSDIDGLGAWIEYAVEDTRRKIHGTINEGAAIGEGAMIMTVPKGFMNNPHSEGTQYRMPFRRMVETIARDRGQDIGGVFRAWVGLRDPPEHAWFVMDGTSWFKSIGRDTMTFQKYGEPRKFIRSRRGQHPQNQWFDDSADMAEDHIDARLREHFGT